MNTKAIDAGHAPPVIVDDDDAAPSLSVCVPFPGFYDSILSGEIDATEEYLAECFAEEPEREGLPEGVTREHIGAVLFDCVDYRAVENTLARAYVDTLADMVNEHEKENDAPPYSFEFEEMTSPREYNFSTDRVFVRVPLAELERMRLAISPATWADVLRDRFTSRSGFISFYSANPEAWNAKPLSEWDHNETGALFAAWLVDNLPDESTRDESIEWRVYSEMVDRGDSPFYSAVSEGIDYAALVEKVAEEMKKK